MTTLFDKCVDEVIGIEGAYSNNPNDSGGETMWGITIAVARAHGYQGSMRSMSKDIAKMIYRDRFWDSQMLDQISVVSERIAYEMFDTGINQGVAAAGKYLQRALNVLNQQGSFYPDIQVDGRIGPMTVASLKEYFKRRPDQGVVVLLRALNCLQGEFYIGLAEARAKDEDFIYGWLLRRVT